MNTARLPRCQRCNSEGGVKRAGLMQGVVLCRGCADDIQQLIDRWQKNKFRVAKATDIDDIRNTVRDEFTKNELRELSDKTRISVFNRDEDPREG